MEGVTFEELEYAKPSLAGTSKAIGIWAVGSKVSTASNGLLPAHIIAIRGTTGSLDHLVNANGRPSPADDFLVNS